MFRIQMNCQVCVSLTLAGPNTQQFKFPLSITDKSDITSKYKQNNLKHFNYFKLYSNKQLINFEFELSMESCASAWTGWRVFFIFSLYR